jgi:hypothetical protein
MCMIGSSDFANIIDFHPQHRACKSCPIMRDHLII